MFGIEASQVDRDTALLYLGLDSLMAVELMNRLESELHLSIPMGSILSGPNVRQLAAILLGLVLAGVSGSDDSQDGDTASSPAAGPAANSTTQLADFWTNQLDTLRSVCIWPSVASDQQKRTESDSVVPLTLTVDMFLQLMAFSAEMNLPVSAVSLFAAWQLTLHRFCNQPDLVIGYEFVGKKSAELETTADSRTACHFAAFWNRASRSADFWNVERASGCCTTKSGTDVLTIESTAGMARRDQRQGQLAGYILCGEPSVDRRVCRITHFVVDQRGTWPQLR